MAGPASVALGLWLAAGGAPESVARRMRKPSHSGSSRLMCAEPGVNPSRILNAVNAVSIFGTAGGGAAGSSATGGVSARGSS